QPVSVPTKLKSIGCVLFPNQNLGLFARENSRPRLMSRADPDHAERALGGLQWSRSPGVPAAFERAASGATRRFSGASERRPAAEAAIDVPRAMEECKERPRY